MYIQSCRTLTFIHSLKALNQRLQTLGLQHPSYDDLNRALAGSQFPPSPPSKTPKSAHSQRLGSSFQSPDRPKIHYPATNTELRPDDSISMYPPFPGTGPASSYRSSRRGGTNVDPGDRGEVEYGPEDRFEEDWVSQAGVTMGSPRSGLDSQEQMTLAPTSAWTTGTL